MSATLALEPDVADRRKTEAARSDLVFKSVVNDALRRGLKIPTWSTLVEE
jgi:hypothetical protein